MMIRDALRAGLWRRMVETVRRGTFPCLEFSIWHSVVHKELAPLSNEVLPSFYPAEDAALLVRASFLRRVCRCGTFC